MKNFFVRFVREEEGQDLIGTALLAGLISVVAITAITSAGVSVNKLFTTVSDALTTPPRSWLSGAIGSAVLPSRRVLSPSILDHLL